MKQFDLETYNRLVAEGKTPKVVTRNGKNVRVLCTDRVGIHPVIALYAGNEGIGATEEVGLHYADGRFDRDKSFPDDLFFADLEPTYRPYKDREECFKDAVKHGFWYLDEKGNFCHPCKIIEYGFSGLAYCEIVKRYVWADDGTPCGVKEEEI